MADRLPLDEPRRRAAGPHLVQPGHGRAARRRRRRAPGRLWAGVERASGRRSSSHVVRRVVHGGAVGDELLEVQRRRRAPAARPRPGRRGRRRHRDRGRSRHVSNNGSPLRSTALTARSSWYATWNVRKAIDEPPRPARSVQRSSGTLATIESWNRPADRLVLGGDPIRRSTTAVCSQTRPSDDGCDDGDDAARHGDVQPKRRELGF